MPAKGSSEEALCASADNGSVELLKPGDTLLYGRVSREEPGKADATPGQRIHDVGGGVGRIYVHGYPPNGTIELEQRTGKRLAGADEGGAAEIGFRLAGS